MDWFKLRKPIVLSAGILFLLFLAEWWLFYLSGLNIPEYIPNTPINTGGLAIIITIVILLILEFKKLLKLQPSLSVWKLVSIGIVTVFMAEVLFQSLRQFFVSADTLKEQLYYFFLGTIGVSLLSSVFSFLIAFQLKTKKIVVLFLFVILVLLGFYVIKLLKVA